MRKVLPKKWCIKDCRETTDYMHKIFRIDDVVFNDKFLHIDTIKKDWIYLQIKKKGYTEITLEEFKKLVLKENNNTTMEKPKTFCIEGKPHQIKAIYQDLVDMGYKEEYDHPVSSVVKDTRLSQSYTKCDSFEDYIDIIPHNDENDLDVTFNLPQDYSKALKFAKKQLESKYWNKDVIVTLGCDDDVFDVKVIPGKSITFENKNINIQMLKHLVTASEVTHRINDWKINYESVTIGCKHNIPIEDIKKVIDAYNS